MHVQIASHVLFAATVPGVGWKISDRPWQGCERRPEVDRKMSFSLNPYNHHLMIHPPEEQLSLQIYILVGAMWCYGNVLCGYYDNE